MSSQWGHARGWATPSGSNTFTYRSVTKDWQFWQVGIRPRRGTANKRITVDGVRVTP